MSYYLPEFRQLEMSFSIVFEEGIFILIFYNMINDKAKLQYIYYDELYNLLQHISQREDERWDPQGEPCRLEVEEVLLSLRLVTLCFNNHQRASDSANPEHEENLRRETCLT